MLRCALRARPDARAPLCAAAVAALTAALRPLTTSAGARQQAAAAAAAADGGAPAADVESGRPALVKHRHMGVGLPPNLQLDKKTRVMLHAAAQPTLPRAPPPMSDTAVPVVSFLTAAPTGATVTLDARVFGTPQRRDIVQRVLVWQNKNARTTTYKTKTRAEVRGGGRKPWKQKGTGRARHGSIRSPLWRGGGKAHGPVLRDWSIDLPKRVRRMGLRVALAAKFCDRRLLVVDSLAMTSVPAGDVGDAGDAGDALAPIVAGKTRALAALLARHGLAGSRALFIDGDHPPLDFRRAIRNLPRMKPLPARGANVADIVQAQVLVVTPAALAAVTEFLLQDFAQVQV